MEVGSAQSLESYLDYLEPLMELRMDKSLAALMVYSTEALMDTSLAALMVHLKEP